MKYLHLIVMIASIALVSLSFAETMAPAPPPYGPTVAEPRIDTTLEQAPAPVKKGSPAFFEPKQADFDCCAVQIKQQQDAYLSARDGKRYAEARSLALFYFVRAWLYNNEAFDIIEKNQSDSNLTELKHAQDLLENARGEIASALTAGHHSSEIKSCERKVNKNLHACAELISKALEADEQ